MSSPPILALASLLLACSGIVGCSGAAQSSGGGTETADDGDDVDDGDDERDRLLTQFREKQEQCGAFGAHIEKSEAGMAIVNLNDAAKLRALATHRRDVGASTAKLELTLAELVQLRDRYRDASDAMAGALRDAAEGRNVSQQKQALDRYRKLDSDVTTLVDELNTYCAKPIEE